MTSQSASDEADAPKPAAHDLFDVYSVAIADTNELKSYGQQLDSVVADIIGIAIDVIVLIYLFQPRVRQAFRQS